jgi:hypothetical protein
MFIRSDYECSSDGKTVTITAYKGKETRKQETHNAGACEQNRPGTDYA